MLGYNGCNQDVHSLLEVAVQAPEYSSPVGPFVDGTIIPESPDLLMERYRADYDLMFGLTQQEAFHLFPAFTVSQGLSDTEQRKVLRLLLRAEFGVEGGQREQLLATVYNEYRDLHQTREDKLTNLRTMLDIFSDCRVAAPLIQAANLHSNNHKEMIH